MTPGQDQHDVAIRPARQEDLPILVNLIWDDPIGREREDRTEEGRSAYEAALSKILKDPNSLLVVAETQGEVVGCVHAVLITHLSYRGAKRLLIEDLRVSESRRGAGIGSRLIHEAERFALEQGCQVAELFVHSDRTAAHRLYERLGYAGRHRGFRKRLGPQD